MTTYKTLPLFALARRNDPVTSHVAADAISKGKASRQGAKVLEALRATDGLTAGELEQRLGFHAHKRTAELERLGKIARGKARKCRASGTLRLTWWVKNTQAETP